jgi:hypothetical protein
MRHNLLASLLLSALPACHRAPSLGPVGARADAGSTNGDAEAVDPSLLSVSPDTLSQIEPTLAVTADGAVGVAWMGTRPGGRTTIGFRYSRDSGATWSQVRSIDSPDDRAGADPVLAADPAGDLYLAWLGIGSSGYDGKPDAHLYVARAEAGTGVFGPPTDLTQDQHHGTKIERPWLAVSGTGALIATWAYASSFGDGVGFARATDGHAWVNGTVVERIDLRASLPYVCASSRGDHLWVTYTDADSGIRVRASDDVGQNWSPARVSTVSTPDERARVAEDTPVCVGEGDDVTIAYGLRPAGDAGAGGGTTLDEIVLAKSFDGGRTFDQRRVVQANGAPMMHPRLTREPDGAIDLAFYAAGSTPGTSALRWIRAADDKAPLQPSKVARDHLRVDASPKDAAWPGSYFGWAWHDGWLYAASIDASAALPHVTFTRIASR